jgi:hypothetical protein
MNSIFSRVIKSKILVVIFVSSIIGCINSANKPNENIIKKDSLIGIQIDTDLHIAKKMTIPDNLEDNCKTANMIRKAIINFVKQENDYVFSKNFTHLLEENCNSNYNCYFPRNIEEMQLYYYFQDSALFKSAKRNFKSVKLAFELYLINSNNAELSEYSYYFIPKLALNYPLQFIIALKTLKNKEDINKILMTLCDLKKSQKKIIKKNMRDISSDKKYYKLANMIILSINNCPE